MVYDVAIIGAGVVGALVARELSRYRLSVALLDKENDVACGATKANSAIIHAGFDARPGTLKAELNVQGAARMPKLSAELGVPYQNIGSLVVAFSEEEMETLHRLLEQGRENGVEGLCILSPEELFEKEPNLSRSALGALWAPTAGIICPYGLCIAAAGNAMDNGCAFFPEFDVESIEEQGEVFAISSQGRALQAKYLVNAAGLYADRIAQMLGDESFQIHARRGEYLLLDRSCGPLVRHTVFPAPGKMGKGILISPTVHGNLILGPTAEDLPDKTDHDTTAPGLSRVRQSVLHTVPSLPLRQVITSFAGLRAVGSTGDFILRRQGARTVCAAAIESPGLSASPAIAERVVSLLQEAGLPLVKKESFTANRLPMDAFKSASESEKEEWIRRDPRYGRIVCRCEEVTEGEIVAALHQNPPPRDVDGLKRRLRTGMGRCQGGFCTPFLTEILAREWGVSEEIITKKGKGSTYLIGRTKG